jgi:hypothetical protein
VADEEVAVVVVMALIVLWLWFIAVQMKIKKPALTFRTGLQEVSYFMKS